MNKKSRITIVTIILLGLISIIFLTIFVLANQKIETDYITFELPKMATHYWLNDGLDKYEVIISNFSIKDNEDYILRLTWYDDRYIDETIQVHYEFKDNRLIEDNINFYSLSKYDKSCIDDIATSISSTPYKDCEKAKDESKLRFNTPKIEMGTLIDYEHRLEKNLTCLKCSLINISYPIYSWSSYSDITITKIPPDFLAIDDVNISTCGTLATANENYTMNASIYYPSGDGCFIISADNITFNMAEYWLNGSTSSTTYGFNIESDNIIIRNGTIYSWQYYGIYQGATYNNLTVSNVVFDWIANYAVHILGDNNTVKDSNFSRIGSDVGEGGIYAEGDYLTIDNVYMNDMYEEGIVLSGSYISISNSLLKNFEGIAGIWFSEAGNYNTINNVKIINATYNLLLDTTDHNIIQNSNFSFGRTNDVIVQTTSINNTFINVTYNISIESVEAGSQLIRKWYYRAYVNDTNDNVISDVNISIYNKTGDWVYNMSTDAVGYTSIFNIIDYVNNGSTRTYFSNYTIYANKTSYIGDWHVYNVSFNENNLKDVFTITAPNTAPTMIVQNTFINWSAGHKFNVTAGVTDAEGATDIIATNITVSSGDCDNAVNSSSGDNFNSTWNCTGTGLTSTNIVIGFTDSGDEYISSDLSANVYPNQAPATPTNLDAEATRTQGQTITATGCTTTDADGDSMQNYFQFYNNNDTTEVQAYSTTNDYTLQSTDVHDQIRTRCKVDDGYVNTTEDEVLTDILDTLPTTPTNLAVEATRTQGQTITATGCDDSSDADGDTINYLFEFHNTNDTSTVQAYSSTNTYTLQSTDVHDQIRTRCKANTTYGQSGEDTEYTTILNTAPNQPSISYPVDGKNYSNIPYINYTATDDDGDTLNYTLYINNTINVTGISTNVTQWNASDGYYNLTVTASDGMASSVNSTVVHFRLDTIAPSWSGNQTNASLMKINGNATFNITITDGGSGLSYYIFSWNGTGEGWLNDTNGSISGNSVKLIVNKSTNLSQGNTIGYRWYANDSLNQWNMSLLRTFTVVNTLPTTPTDLTADNNKKVTETIIALCTDSTDADDDVITYYYEFYNTDDAGTVQAYSTTATYVVQVSDAHNEIRVRCKAYDSIGYSGEDTVNVDVADTLPTVPSADSLAPNNPVITDELAGECSGSTDADNDVITYHCRFYDITDSNERQAFSTDCTYQLVSPTDSHDQFRLDCRAVTDLGNSATDRTGTDLETVGNTVPNVPTIISPYDGEWNNTRKIEFNSSDIDGDAISYTIYINNTLNITTTTNITVWNGSDGYYNLTMTANDSTGVSANSSVIYFTLDTTPPTITFIYPTNGSNISSNSIDLNATAIDNFNSSSMTFYWVINGTTNTTTIQANTTFNASDGYYNLTLFVSDGLQNGSSTIFFRLDTVAPSITSLINRTIDDGTSVFYTNDNIYSNATITDNGGGLDTIIFSFNLSDGTWHNNTVTSSTSLYSFNITSTNISNAGNKWMGWRYYANDTAGNMNFKTVNYFVNSIVIEEEVVAGHSGGSGIGTTGTTQQTAQKLAEVDRCPIDIPFTSRLFSTCKIDNDICDEGEWLLIDEDCKLDKNLFFNMWFLRLTLFFSVLLFIRKNNYFPLAVMFFIVMLYTNGFLY